jgi:hypothetical protein
MRRLLPALAFFLIALVILAPIVPQFGDHLIYPTNSEFSDLTITHWPAFAYARDQIAVTGQAPLWRTSILSGTPFASDPLSGLFYPLHWIALILPLPVAFNLLMFVHLMLAAASMYVLMRRWNVGRVASMVSAIAYAAAPKIIAHMAVGHVTLVEAWAWLPLVIAGLYSFSHRDISPAERQSIRYMVIEDRGWGVGSGLALAMCLLADVRMAIYAAVLAVTYLVIQYARRDRSAWLKMITHIILVMVVGATVSAAVWLPALSLANDTARASIAPEEAATQSLDPVYLLGVVIADRSGAAERTTYLGLTVLILAIVGVKLFYRRDRRRVLWLLSAIIVGAIVALGSNTPLYRLLSALPGSTLLRVPARAWFVVTFAAAALAGLGVQGLIEWSGTAKPRSIFAALLVAFTAVIFGAFGALGNGSLSFVAFALWVPIACLLITLRLMRKLSADRFAIFIVMLISIDLISIDWALYRSIPIDTALTDGRAAAEWIAGQVGAYRVYSPSYSIPQQVAQEFHLQLADGIDPLQLARYVTFMQTATGAGEWKYSVTLPAFPNIKTDADIRSALANVVPNVELLGLLNVKYIVAAFPIEHIDLVERAHFGSTYIYENVLVMPRAFVLGHVDTAPDEQAAAHWLDNNEVSDAAVVEGLPQSLDLPIQPHEAQIVSEQPDRIEVHASGPGLLVLGEVYAPDWIATIDDQPAPIFPTDLTLRGIILPWGDHTIVLSYQPKRVYAGALISILSLIACAAARGIAKNNQRNLSSSVSPK